MQLCRMAAIHVAVFCFNCSRHFKATCRTFYLRLLLEKTARPVTTQQKVCRKLDTTRRKRRAQTYTTKISTKGRYALRANYPDGVVAAGGSLAGNSALES